MRVNSENSGITEKQMCSSSNSEEMLNNVSRLYNFIVVYLQTEWVLENAINIT